MSPIIDHLCVICSRSFKRKEHLVRHLRTHTGEKPFQCTVCFKDFSRKDQLKRHSQVHARVQDLLPCQSDCDSAIPSHPLGSDCSDLFPFVSMMDINKLDAVDLVIPQTTHSTTYSADLSITGCLSTNYPPLSPATSESDSIDSLSGILSSLDEPIFPESLLSHDRVMPDSVIDDILRQAFFPPLDSLFYRPPEAQKDRSLNDAFWMYY